MVLKRFQNYSFIGTIFFPSFITYFHSSQKEWFSKTIVFKTIFFSLLTKRNKCFSKKSKLQILTLAYHQKAEELAETREEMVRSLRDERERLCEISPPLIRLWSRILGDWPSPTSGGCRYLLQALWMVPGNDGWAGPCQDPLVWWETD